MAGTDRTAPSSKPDWLRRKIPVGAAYHSMLTILADCGVHTVCRESQCPNTGECFSHGIAAILILGTLCTRSCRFCAVGHGRTVPPDPNEPDKVADMVQRLGLRYTVITSVTRDDLPDGGAEQFAATVREIRLRVPDIRIEVLIPDFGGSEEALQTIIAVRPDVIAHNLDTVPRLYPAVKPGSDYRRSLGLLTRSARFAPGIPVKSGLMLGMEESPGEVESTLRDLVSAGCRIVTIGQYLSPSREHFPVSRFVPPEEFDRWRETALGMGFASVVSGPLVRSSYRAGE